MRWTWLILFIVAVALILSANGFAVFTALTSQDAATDAVCRGVKTNRWATKIVAQVERDAIAYFRGDELEAQNFLERLDVVLSNLRGTDCQP